MTRKNLGHLQVIAGLVFTGLIFTSATPAQSAPIQGGDAIKIDFSTTGDGDGGSLADWNQVSGPGDFAPGTVIRHGDGAIVDGVGITFANLVAGNFNNDGNSAAWGGTAGDPYYILGADDIYFHGIASDFSVTFSGLDPLLSYNARIYSLISNSDTAVEGFTVTDGAGTQSNAVTRDTRWSAATLEAGGTVFSDLQVNGSNEIVITVNDVSSPFYPLNAIVLEAIAAPVPEPASALLVVLGLAGLAITRRRPRR